MATAAAGMEIAHAYPTFSTLVRAFAHGYVVYP